MGEDISTAAPGAKAAIAAGRHRHYVVSALIAISAASLIGLLGFALKLDQSKVPPANIDKAALPFKVAFVQGNDLVPGAKGQDHFTLADLRGHPVILNFWARWCVSCREEAREFERFWQSEKDKVIVVGIAIQDTPEDAKRFAAYYGKTYVLGLDEDGKAAIDYGVSGVPETFFIDKQGIIRHKEIGPVDSKKMQEFLPQIL